MSKKEFITNSAEGERAKGNNLSLQLAINANQTRVKPFYRC